MTAIYQRRKGWDEYLYHIIYTVHRKQRWYEKLPQKREHLVLGWNKVLSGSSQVKTAIFEYKNQGSSRS
jgi:hypothetical protein